MGVQDFSPNLQGDTSWHGTTVLCVRGKTKTVMAADGQVSAGATVIKSNAKKLRRLSEGNTLAGFGGTTADAFALLERLESKLEQHPGQLERACVALARDWRTDRYLRRLEAMLIVANTKVALLISGNGDVLEPEDGLIAIGSGGAYALAAARAFSQSQKSMPPEKIAKQSLEIAAEICVYTNLQITTEELLHEPADSDKGKTGKDKTKGKVKGKIKGKVAL